MPDFAKAAHEVLVTNKDRGGQVARHAVAWAFVYALLDLADAIRGRTNG